MYSILSAPRVPVLRVRELSIRFTDHFHVTGVEHCSTVQFGAAVESEPLYSSFCPQSGLSRKCTCLCLYFNVPVLTHALVC